MNNALDPALRQYISSTNIKRLNHASGQFPKLGAVDVEDKKIPLIMIQKKLFLELKASIPFNRGNLTKLGMVTYFKLG